MKAEENKPNLGPLPVKKRTLRIDWTLVVAICALLVSAVASSDKISDWFNDPFSKNYQYAGTYRCVLNCPGPNKIMKVEINGGRPVCTYPPFYGQIEKSDQGFWNGNLLHCFNYNATWRSWGITWDDASQSAWLKTE